MEIRKELTNEWKKRGLKQGVQFATLTDIDSAWRCWGISKTSCPNNCYFVTADEDNNSLPQ